MLDKQLKVSYNDVDKFNLQDSELNTFVPVNLNSNKITGLTNGIADTDAISK